MVEVIGIKLKEWEKNQFFYPNGLQLAIGIKCIVESEFGLEIGTVVTPVMQKEEIELAQVLHKVVRVITQEDLKTIEANKEKEKEAYTLCVQKIEQYNIQMKLIDVGYSFDGTKATFYFTAEKRLDFRELLKDLATVLKVRIDMRQIGARDETRMCGGYGPCGRKLCCITFLKDFTPVSMRMAKDQNLALNPGKISGICGRLMCCLAYEHVEYKKR